MSGATSTRERRLRLLGVLLAGLATLWLALAFMVFSADDPDAAGPRTRADHAWAFDYEAYVDAARRLSATGSPYQPETLEGPFRPGPYGLYLYSPTLAVGLSPLVDVEAEGGELLWYAAHVLALAAACALMPVRLDIRLVGFAVAAFSYAIMRDLALGNVSVLLLLPLAAAWRWLDRPAGSVAMALAISVRPTLGILLAWQLLRRQWRAVAWTIGAGLGLILVTLPLVGLDGYLDYLAVLRNMSDVSGVPFNHDLGSVLLDLQAGESIASVALLAGYVLAICAMLLSLRRDREVSFMVTVTGSLLLAPLLWDHYLALLVLPAAFLAGRGQPWAILLPLASWLPVIDEAWTWLYPAIVIVAMLLPFAARERPVAHPSSAPLVAAKA